MADIIIHGITDEVLEHLRRDAEANGQTPEDVARLILENWHRLLEYDRELAERTHRHLEAVNESPTRLEEKMSEWRRATDDLKKRLRTKQGDLKADQ